MTSHWSSIKALSHLSLQKDFSVLRHFLGVRFLVHIDHLDQLDLVGIRQRRVNSFAGDKLADSSHDFFLCAEGLKIMAGIGEFVTRKGIYPPLPDADKIELVEMIDMDQKPYAEKMAEYRNILLKR